MTLEPETIEEDLTFEARPVRILEESDKVLRRKTLKYLKILWTNQTGSNMGARVANAGEVPGVLLI
jgi:hypothetical protein